MSRRLVSPPLRAALPATQPQAATEDIYEAIRFFERTRPARPAFDGGAVNGQWRLQFTTGTAEKASNATKRRGGSFFPLAAVQSFNAATGHIRNGIYAGPLSFFFDGPYLWDDQRKILEFTFDRVSLAWGDREPLRFNIAEGAWEKLKGAEEMASEGQGKVAKAAASGRKASESALKSPPHAPPLSDWPLRALLCTATGSSSRRSAGSQRWLLAHPLFRCAQVNPFFKWVYADDKCIAARGRGGGLALWSRESSTPVEVDDAYYATRPRPSGAAGSGAKAAEAAAAAR